MCAILKGVVVGRSATIVVFYNCLECGGVFSKKYKECPSCHHKDNKYWEAMSPIFVKAADNKPYPVGVNITGDL
jgi:lipopolysaccharide biosynthesis regulator YciM